MARLELATSGPPARRTANCATSRKLKSIKAGYEVEKKENCF